jgi:hypothetical protein
VGQVCSIDAFLIQYIWGGTKFHENFDK